MPGAFQVQPASLRQAGGRIQAAAADLSDALAQLESTLGGLGDVCGDDDQGRKFAAGYDPASSHLRTAASNIAHGLQTIAAALDATADNYDGSDSAGSRLFGNGGGNR